MRKQVIWWIMVGLIVLALILGFENILESGQYHILFFEVELSGTILIFLMTGLGFLIGFCFMLYSFEIRREKELSEEEDAVALSPAKEVQSKEVPKAPVTKADTFDEDDEILG